MGVRHPPGSTGRLGGGQSDDLAQYGRGECRDGIYEWYELPDEGSSLTLDDLLEQEDLLILDFQEVYGIALEEADHLTWWQFRRRVIGLMSTESRISRHFARAAEPDTPEGDA